MKRMLFIILTAFIFGNVNSIKAQYNTSGIKDMPIPTVSPLHHLYFNGVSMGRTIEEFRTKLGNNGFRFVSNDPNNEYYMKAEVEKGALEGCYLDVEYNKQLKAISCLSIYSFNRLWVDAKPKFEKVLKEIQRDYPNAYFDLGIFKDEYGSRIEKYCWKILSKDNKFILGSIYVTINMNRVDECYTGTIKYYDYPNAMKVENINFGDYDISTIMFPDYNACFLYIDDDYLILYPVKNNKTGVVVADEEDRKNIIKLIDTKDIYKSEIREKISRYLAKMPIFDENDVCMTSSCFNNQKVYWGIGDDIIKKRKEEARNEAIRLRKDQINMYQKKESNNNIKENINKLKRDLHDWIIGKDLVDFYKKRGMLNGIYNSIDKMSLGGSSSSGTNWDGLNDAQKSVIHQNDNAR